MKKGRMEFLSKFYKPIVSDNSGEDGKELICVGEKTKRLEIFLNINKQGGSNNSEWDGKFPENY